MWQQKLNCHECWNTTIPARLTSSGVGMSEVVSEVVVVKVAAIIELVLVSVVPPLALLAPIKSLDI